MNAAGLLEHYERIADAPDAVAKLRRLILNMGVRGKLIAQDPNDEPASELLKRIAAEKAAKLGPKIAPTAIDQPESLGDLPGSWCAVPLISLGFWAIGSGFPKNEQGLDKGPYFFLKVSDMNLPGNEKYMTTSNNFIDDVAAKRMRAKIHPSGTIIFPKIGGAIATNKRRILTRGAAIDNNCLGISFSGEVDFEWAFILLTAIDFTRYQVGTAVPALQQSILERIPVGLPPLAEQRRIVAKFDELMALCDQLEAARAEREARHDRLAAASLARFTAPDPETFHADARFALDVLPSLTARANQIQQFRQAILNLAVQGLLVAQDPTDAPASDLIRQIAIEKARLQKAGLIPATKVSQRDPSWQPANLPGSWEVIALGDACSLVTSGSRGWAEFYADAGPLFVRAQNIRFGRLILDQIAFVNPPIKAEGSRTRIEKGDVLIVITGAGVTNPATVDHDLGDAYVSQHVGLARPVDLRLSAWMLLCLMAPTGGREELVARAYGSGKPGLNLENIRSLTVPVPPLAEQARILSMVDSLMALCDRLQASLDAGNTTRSRLLDALLHEALESRFEMVEAD